MPPSIASFLTSVPPTSELEAPTQVQRPDDFASDRTNRPAESAKIDSRIDLRRLRGYEPLPHDPTNTSFIWAYGWRLVRLSDQSEHWLCRICHTGPPRTPNPAGHIFKSKVATTSPRNHLIRKHGIQNEGDTPTNTSSGQSSIEDHLGAMDHAPTAVGASTFDFETFKGLLLQLFISESLSFTKIDAKALRDLLVYLQPQLNGIIPSRRSLRRYIDAAYDQSLGSVEHALQLATTRINLSFDLWTSPGRRLALLGVVAHYLDANYKPKAVLLALPSMHGSHTGANIAERLTLILNHFKLRDRFGHAITDNASENTACMNLLSTELNMTLNKRHVLCMGHIINLVAHQILFGEDIEAFEDHLENVALEELELRCWRRKGPIGKLHNLIRYICHSNQRREVFKKVQQRQPQPDGSQPSRSYDLIRDNLTRWNSWFDAAQRALDLRPSIDDYLDDELQDYDSKLRQWERRGSQGRGPPKKPSLFDDRLTNDDWTVITWYVDLLKPCKEATMRLQGNVNLMPSKHQTGVKGAIWQVLPCFEEIMSALEAARERHMPSGASQQPVNSQPHFTASPLSPPASKRRRLTRRSEPQSMASICTNNHDNPANIDRVPAPEQTTELQGAEASLLETHFTTNINLGWQKLDHYYNRTDVTPIHRAAVFLHPRLKWRWFEKHWRSRAGWIHDAKLAIQELWSEYKVERVTTAVAAVTESRHLPARDEWSDDDPDEDLDQLEQYEREGYARDLTASDSPIPYWIAKQPIWPQLAQMALDIYSTPAMSDDPERVFSIAGNTLNPRRRCLKGETVQQVLCLRSWQNSGLIHLDRRLFNKAVAAAQAASIEADLAINHGGDGDDDDPEIEHVYSD